MEWSGAGAGAGWCREEGCCIWEMRERLKKHEESRESGYKKKRGTLKKEKGAGVPEAVVLQKRNQSLQW